MPKRAPAYTNLPQRHTLKGSSVHCGSWFWILAVNSRSILCLSVWTSRTCGTVPKTSDRYHVCATVARPTPDHTPPNLEMSGKRWYAENCQLLALCGASITHLVDKAGTLSLVSSGPRPLATYTTTFYVHNHVRRHERVVDTTKTEVRCREEEAYGFTHSSKGACMASAWRQIVVLSRTPERDMHLSLSSAGLHRWQTQVDSRGAYLFCRVCGCSP